MKRENQEAVIRLLEAVQEKFERVKQAAVPEGGKPEYIIKPEEYREMCEDAGMNAETEHLLSMFALALANGIVRKPDFIKFTLDMPGDDDTIRIGGDGIED